MARAEALGESQRKEFRSDVPRGGGTSPEGGTGSSGQHGEECVVEFGRGEDIGCAMLSVATAVTTLKSRFAGEGLELGPFVPTCGTFRDRKVHVITGKEL